MAVEVQRIPQVNWYGFWGQVISMGLQKECPLDSMSQALYVFLSVTEKLEAPDACVTILGCPAVGAGNCFHENIKAARRNFPAVFGVEVQHRKLTGTLMLDVDEVVPNTTLVDLSHNEPSCSRVVVA